MTITVRSVRPLLSGLAAACVLSAGLAHAAVYSNGTATATFDTTMTIVANCIISASALDFGQAQGVLSSSVSATSALSVTCTNTTPYNVGLNAGTGAGSSTSARLMSGTGGNTSTVAYNLMQTAGGVNWGDIQGTDTKSGTGTGSAQTLTVYGVVPPQSTPQPDTYKSTITATVYF